MPDTLLVDGTDIKALSGVVVNSIDYFAPAKRRGDNDTVPGRQGQIGHSKPLDSFSFSANITVKVTSGATVNLRRVNMVANLRAFMKSCRGDGGQVLLQRVLMTGESSTTTTEALGEFVGANSFSLLNYQTGKTEVEFINLDGAWSDTAYTTPVALPNSNTNVTNSGDFTTNKILIVLPGAGTLTNGTTGVAVTVTTACTLDVAAFTATSGIGTLTHTGADAWMLLNPGVNVLFWSGAASGATISHKAMWV